MESAQGFVLEVPAVRQDFQGRERIPPEDVPGAETMKKPIKWTTKHKREALRFILRRCDVVAATGPLQSAGRIQIGPRHFEDERALRRTLASMGMGAPAGDRIDREVALVHALATASPEVHSMIKDACADHERIVAKLATGRFMRVSFVELHDRDDRRINAWDDDKRERRFAHAAARAYGGKVVRAHRIRRAT